MAKKAKTPEQPQFGYKVDFSHVQKSYKREKQKYGSWSAVYENKLNGISRNDQYPDITSTLDIQAGDDVYVVWCEWNSGDSFGNGQCAGYEAVGVFKDQKAAIEFAQWIDRQDRDSDSVSLYEEKKKVFKACDGQVFEFGYMPWTGYFERLVKVHAQSVKMNVDMNFDSDSRVEVH